jgi:hypothetical protein
MPAHEPVCPREIPVAAPDGESPSPQQLGQQTSGRARAQDKHAHVTLLAALAATFAVAACGVPPDVLPDWG